jgi:hypothetical protein
VQACCHSVAHTTDCVAATWGLTQLCLRGRACTSFWTDQCCCVQPWLPQHNLLATKNLVLLLLQMLLWLLTEAHSNGSRAAGQQGAAHLIAAPCVAYTIHVAHYAVRC